MIAFRVVLPFLAGYFLSYVFRAVNAVLAPTLAREFGLTAAELGFLTGVYFFSFGLFQIPLGLLLDRFGPRRVNGTLLVVAAMGGLVFANAQSFGTLVLARGLIGLGVSACLMASIQAFVLWFAPERTATMIAIAFSVGGLGALAASTPLDAALQHFDWRQVFTFLSLATIALSALFALWVPEHAPKARAAPLAAQLDGLGRILRDAGFWRAALAIGANQCAVVSLFTLWITAWLRDVAGYDRASAAAGLGWVAVAMIGGYLFFGRLADILSRRGRSPLWLFIIGVAASLSMLALLAARVTTGAVGIWAAFVFFGTGATLAHSIATRRYPREMAGRVNTALNTFTFVGIFLGQWATGIVLNAFPPSASGYDPRGYSYALAGLAVIQAAGLAWLWSGRRLLIR